MGRSEAPLSRRPSPRQEVVVGIVTQSVVLTLVPAWGFWLFCDLMRFPHWLWVVSMACPAVLLVCRVRSARVGSG